MEEFKGGVDVWSWKDHRIAMTLAIASTRCKEDITLIDYDCVAKSYPSFFEDFKMLGGIANEWNVEIILRFPYLENPWQCNRNKYRWLAFRF